MTGLPGQSLADIFLPVLGLAALAVVLPVVFVPRDTRSHVRVSISALTSALILLVLGAILFAVFYQMRGHDVLTPLSTNGLGTAWFFLIRSAQAALIWGPVLAIVWFSLAQRVEKNRGVAKMNEGRST